MSSVTECQDVAASYSGCFCGLRCCSTKVLVLSAAAAVVRALLSVGGTAPKGVTYRLDICKVNVHISCSGDDVRDAPNTLQHAAQQSRAQHASHFLPLHLSFTLLMQPAAACCNRGAMQGPNLCAESSEEAKYNVSSQGAKADAPERTCRSTVSASLNGSVSNMLRSCTLFLPPPP